MPPGDEVTAAVVIPTKNGGALFRRVIDAVLDQATPWEFEVLVVDSGSADGTVEYCRSLDRVRVHCIAPEEFGHGRTRNLGISMVGGEFVALITQDALPADRHWLNNLVAAVEQADDVAGAFGRHLPYPDAGPYLARDLKQHFDGFLAWPKVMRLDDPGRYAAEVGYRQVLHYFSNNNSCIRRSVWEKYPIAEVDFAEDQIWAKSVVEAGYGKAYADDARVYHSHNYSVVETARRAFDEARALQRLFGYRLCPSVAHLLAQTVRCTFRDFLFSWENDLVVRNFGALAASPLHNLMRQSGFYLGQRADRMPPFLRDLISLDQSKKRAGA